MERPIICSTPMVHALMAGTKTQTRRVVKEQPELGFIYQDGNCYQKIGGWPRTVELRKIKCPYGKVGDLLWVRESLYQNGELGLEYFAFNTPINETIIPNNYGPYGGKYSFRAIPSIHMPKWAARIWLQLTEIRIERLQEITEEDSEAEGVLQYADGTYKNYFKTKGLRAIDGVECLLAKGSYQSLWASINGIQSWNANPWVWVLIFKVVSTTGKPETGNQQQATEPRPEETIHLTKTTGVDQMEVTESLKNCTRVGVREFDPDELEDDEMQCCANCDLPDACRDFGCAIKQGLRLPQTII